jgi:regulator of replication initiation timing
MAWYDALKDAIGFAKNAGNVDIQQSLIDVQQQMLDMQQQLLELRQENNALTEEIKQLTDISELEKRIVRHDEAVVTLNDDEGKTKFCSCCWDAKKMLVQMNNSGMGSMTGYCPNCQNKLFSRRR